MGFRANMILAGLTLAVPFLAPAIVMAEEVEPVVYVSSTSSGNVGGVSFADEDILSYETSSDTWEKYFDGSDVGLRRNDVNAFHLQDDGSILMALKNPQWLGGFRADDSDVVAFFPTSLGGDTAGTFERYFDGSDVGLSTNAEEIDSLAMTPDGRLLISTTGSHRVPRSGGGTLWGSDEDLIVFNATSLGSDTSGDFERYFDGSDVNLRSSSEDVWGTWVDPDTGDIFMTTRANYRVRGLTGDKEDIITFSPSSLGTWTSGTFAAFWDGDDHGFSGEYIDGLSVEMVPTSQDPPQFEASLTNDWVNGWSFTPESSVVVEIFASSVDVVPLFSGVVPTDPGGNFNLDAGVHGQDLVPGTYIEVTGSFKTLEMVDVTFDTFDPGTDTIGGTAPVGAVVGFDVGDEGGGVGGETTADGSGDWSVDLNTAEFGNFDLTGAMGGQAYVTDGDGDRTVAEPRFPQFQASLTNDWVQGWSFTPDASVVVEIFGSSVDVVPLFSGVVPTDGGGNFNLDAGVHGQDLVAGTYIEVTGSFKTLEMVDVTFDTFDPGTDTIGGTAPAGSVVGFGGGDESEGFDGETVADGSGNWSVDLNTAEFGNFDLTPTMGAQAWVSDGDGDQTVAEPIPPPAFAASLPGDQIWGWSFTPDASVVVEIFASSVDVVPLFTSDPVPTDPGGNFNLDAGVHGQDLVPGTYIEVTGSFKTLEMVDVTFDTFDPGTDTIAGTAPVGAVVGFDVGNEGGGVGGQVVPDGSGNWSVDLNTAEFGNFDLTGAMGGQAYVTDVDGDQTVAEPRFPQFQASLTNDWVNGWSFTPDASVVVEIFASSVDVVPLFTSDPVPTDGAGNFNLDAGVHGQDLVPGTYIEVTGSFKTLEMVDVTFDTFDPGSDTIAGTAPAGSVVGFDGGNEGSGFGGETTADGSGDWSVDLNTAEFGNFDLTADMGAQARLTDEDGDQTVAEPVPPPSFAASLTGDQIWGWSFTPESSVVVEIFGSSVDVVPLFSGVVPTDGGGNFNLDPQEGIDLVPGTYIEVTGSFKTLEMVDVTFGTFDTGLDRIGGTAPVGAVVGFDVGNEEGGVGGQVVADGSGDWSVDLNTAEFGNFDLTGAMGGQAYVTDVDGDQTVAEPRFPQFQASLTNDWVQGWSFSPDASVVVEIFASSVDVVPLFSGVVPTDGGGNFNLDPQEGIDSVPGTYIEVTGSFKTLEMVDVTFDTFDPGTDTIAGTAPVGAVVGFGGGDESEGFGGETVADGSGNWSVDLNTAEFGNFDLTGTMGAQAWVSDDDGDQTVAEPIPPP